MFGKIKKTAVLLFALLLTAEKCACHAKPDAPQLLTEVDSESIEGGKTLKTFHAGSICGVETIFFHYLPVGSHEDELLANNESGYYVVILEANKIATFENGVRNDLESDVALAKTTSCNEAVENITFNLANCDFEGKELSEPLEPNVLYRIEAQALNTASLQFEFCEAKEVVTPEDLDDE